MRIRWTPSARSGNATRPRSMTTCGARLIPCERRVSASRAIHERALVAATVVTGRQELAHFVQSRDWRGALNWLDQALAVEPRDPHLCLTRAHCLLALGRLRD